MNRRNFFKNTALASTSLMIPNFLSGFMGQPLGASEAGKNLVIIQWTGGNDGLNTVVPFRNDLYYKNRPTLAIAKKEALTLNDELGLNPVMTGFKRLFDDGLVTVINNVGYPNPDRSHFRSMDIWHTASDADEYWATGWLGRYLDLACEGCPPYAALELDDTLSLALKGAAHNGFAATDPRKAKRSADNSFLKTIAHHHDHDHEENVEYLYKTMIDAQSSADYLFEKSKIYTSKQAYPTHELGRDLKQIAELIAANTEARVYYVSLTGFDTHVFQKDKQERLLAAYSEAIAAFVKDLKANNRFDDTLIMTFSEFGRRVRENASRGTDHGTANNLYLIGGNLRKAGIFNEVPNLSNLDDGDLIYSVDFRKVYASILQSWLKVDATTVLGKKIDSLPLL